MSSPAATLFISTYEMPRHLALVCAAVNRQSTSDFEVVICDDGSGAQTASVIEHFIRGTSLQVQHVRQDHQGFRKCRILNEGLRRSSGRIAIFLDGDCVPHRHFVRDHIAMQEQGFYLAGRRVELGPKISDWLTPEAVERGFFDHPRPRLIASAWSGDSENLQRSIYVPWTPVRKLLKMNRVVDLKGCNYSVPRSVLEALNGFDEEYEGYGREDTDIEIRMQHYGLKIKSLKGVALQFHVWHPRREFTPANDSRLENLKRSGQFVCERGLRPLSRA